MIARNDPQNANFKDDAMAIELNSFIALKCVIDGLCNTTGSEGPDGTDAGDAVHRIHAAPLNDLVTGIQLDDWDLAAGLRIVTFVAGDCNALTDDIKSNIWLVTVNRAEHYWLLFPQLPNPFPRAKFKEPTIDCDTATVADLAVFLINSWRKAQ